MSAKPPRTPLPWTRGTILWLTLADDIDFAIRAANSHDDLLMALRRHEWYGTDWNTWRCASCSAEIQDEEERHHDALCPTAIAIAKAEEGS